MFHKTLSENGESGNGIKLLQSECDTWHTVRITNSFLLISVLDALAFERLLGPCMEIMKRNKKDYEEMLVKAFGSKVRFECKWSDHCTYKWSLYILAIFAGHNIWLLERATPAWLQYWVLQQRRAGLSPVPHIAHTAHCTLATHNNYNIITPLTVIVIEA